MNLPTNSDPDSTPETGRVEFLLSRQLDDDLTQAELSELAAISLTDSHRAWFVACTELKRAMQALPVDPVAQSLSANVREAIRRESPSVRTEAVPDRQRGWISRGAVAVSVTACLATLLLIARTRNDELAQDQLVDKIGSPAARAELANATAAVAVADADATRTPAVSETAGEQDDLRPFLENDNWRIVVVKVHSKDRDEVIHDIQELVARNGMDIRPVGGHNDQDARLGVLLTSTGIDDKAMIESILPPAETETAEWNAQAVAESSRENLIARLQESLKIPTHSEMHFGQVYLTLPKPAGPLLAKDSPAEDSALRALADRTKNKPSAGTAAAAVPSIVKLPVLVVFEFTDEAANHI